MLLRFSVFQRYMKGLEKCSDTYAGDYTHTYAHDYTHTYTHTHMHASCVWLKRLILSLI